MKDLHQEEALRICLLCGVGHFSGGRSALSYTYEFLHSEEEFLLIWLSYKY